jgi:Glycosyltransferase family 87
MPPGNQEDDEEDDEEEPASATPKRDLVDPKRFFVSELTLRGLGVALAIAGLVLFHYHVARPWFAEHHIRTSVDEDVACAFKAVLAFSALASSVWAAMRRLAGRPFGQRTVTLALVTFGALGVIAYVGSDDLGATNFVHRWELFHYYLGSKYPEELGYKRLYVCAAVAQAEIDAGQRAEVLSRKIRDLETDVIREAAPVLDHPEECKRHFSPDRWKVFKKDVAWFRHSSSRSFWEGMQTDHGYNPPPVWTMTGHFFGSFFPVATNASMRVLASLDTIVFALTFFFVWWAFGLRVCCVCLVFWGTQFPADGYFTGGAFLRQDWLMYLVMSACLLRKRYWGLAGAALAASALLRVFPGLFFAGIALVALVHVYKHRRFAKHHLRVFAGAAVTTVVLVSASLAVAGPHAYQGFAEHIALHHRTPLTNNMGLPVLLSYTQAGRAEFTRDKSQLDEFGKWADAHSAALAKRRPLYLSLNAFFLIVFFMTVRRIKTLWIAMGLSAILVVTIPTLTCYYYSFLIVSALLSKASRSTEWLTLLAGGVSPLLVLWPRVSYQWDDRFTTQSIVFLGFALILLLGFLREPSTKKADARLAQKPV